MTDFYSDLPNFLDDMMVNEAAPDTILCEEPATFNDTYDDGFDDTDSEPVLEDTTDETVTMEPVAEEETALAPVDDSPVLDDTFFTSDGIAGNSFAWHDDWFWQEQEGYCGPTSAAFLLNQFFGSGITNPEYMVEQALQLGLMTDPALGMTTPDLASLIDAAGLPVEMVYSGVEDLATKLEMGYGVVAIVDSGEIWGEPDDQIYEDNQPDHFLVVTEIDFNNGTVTLADPGNPSGNASVVPLAQFEDAWADSNFEMISTTQAHDELADPSLVDRNMAIINASRSDVIR